MYTGDGDCHNSACACASECVSMHVFHAYTHYSTHVQVRGQLCGVVSLLFKWVLGTGFPGLHTKCLHPLNHLRPGF